MLSKKVYLHLRIVDKNQNSSYSILILSIIIPRNATDNRGQKGWSPCVPNISEDDNMSREDHGGAAGRRSMSAASSSSGVGTRSGTRAREDAAAEASMTNAGVNVENSEATADIVGGVAAPDPTTPGTGTVRRGKQHFGLIIGRRPVGTMALIKAALKSYSAKPRGSGSGLSASKTKLGVGPSLGPAASSSVAPAASAPPPSSLPWAPVLPSTSAGTGMSQPSQVPILAPPPFRPPPVPQKPVEPLPEIANAFSGTTSHVAHPQKLPAVGKDPPRPPNFQHHLDETLASLSTHRLFPIDKDSTEFTGLQDLLSPLNVTSAALILNPDLYLRFITARKEMLRAKSSDLNLLSELFPTDPTVLKAARLSLKFRRDPLLTTEQGKFSPNEALLFHCVRDPNNLANILSQGLDERLGNQDGLFGRGIYFSDSPLKSTNYDRSGGTLLIFAVLLGDCLGVSYHPQHSSLVREPEKKGGQKRDFNDKFFDSITAGVPGKYNEYIIYNRFQCCPLYLVKYRGRAEYQTSGKPPYSRDRSCTPAIAWCPPDATSCQRMSMSMPNQSLDGSWAFFAHSIFREMGAGVDVELDPGSGSSADEQNQKTKCLVASNPTETTDSSSEDEDDQGQGELANEICDICANGYPSFKQAPQLWKELRCGHRICFKCHRKMETTRSTMAGVVHTFINCPFCKARSGTEVGTCPDGQMEVKIISNQCSGYHLVPTIQITYDISTRAHDLHRVAYLPCNREGNAIRELLQTAWDRRLCFAIGTSLTTGQKYVPVWNIHHKTSTEGGPQSYGYPDPGYFQRVREELKAYGIE